MRRLCMKASQAKQPTKTLGAPRHRYEGTRCPRICTHDLGKRKALPALAGHVDDLTETEAVPIRRFEPEFSQPPRLILEFRDVGRTVRGKLTE